MYFAFKGPYCVYTYIMKVMFHEYEECTSIKGRFHQYFIHGESIDCSQWKKDYENCLKYENSDGTDIQAGKAVTESESARRAVRLQSHYANDIWKKRTSPPQDWNKKLPEWLEKKNENTFLELKSKELKGEIPKIEDNTYFCNIM
ncbi:UPF0545 protein C22orf39 homolog isoform X2 [Condylostylus longicornis]|uniref:UPF0545 protein C22orf39 homolog isoform X2 n=1 Tax=Condylostylus longicornis TaxID=2530218 RepID=UPI00244DF98C|nr:UPF0545 protein C22orf39 homolog isoform X2 [Condylostylus longicornis]